MSENKIKPNFPSHLGFQHEDMVNSVLPYMVPLGQSLTGGIPDDDRHSSGTHCLLQHTGGRPTAQVAGALCWGWMASSSGQDQGHCGRNQAGAESGLGCPWEGQEVGGTSQQGLALHLSPPG